MKYRSTLWPRTSLLSAILLLFTTGALAADKDSILNAKGQQLKHRASLIYETKPDSAISFYDQAAELFKAANNKKEAATCLQNIAFVYDEYRKDAYKALLHVREAHTMWKEANDTPNIANIYKYIGYLQTKMNDTRLAKKNIDTAITLYHALHNQVGIASSYYDLATAYDHEKKLDSAVYYLRIAQKKWNKLPESQERVFGINNMLLRMYVLSDKLKEAKTPFRQNTKRMNDEKLSLRDKLTFYYYSWIYLTKSKKEKQAAEYKAMYDKLKTEMTNKGMIV